jgi:hypothetical protein
MPLRAHYTQVRHSPVLLRGLCASVVNPVVQKRAGTGARPYQRQSAFICGRIRLTASPRLRTRHEDSLFGRGRVSNPPLRTGSAFIRVHLRFHSAPLRDLCG